LPETMQGERAEVLLLALGKAQAAWDYYLRNGRPGKPHRDT